MKRSQSEENIILKQKIIHFQSELSRYKEKLKRYEENANVDYNRQPDQDKVQLESKVAELSQKVLMLEKQVEDLLSENRILKENQSNRAAINFDKDGKKHTLDSWFVNNLENQSAIRRPGKNK